MFKMDNEPGSSVGLTVSEAIENFRFSPLKETRFSDRKKETEDEPNACDFLMRVFN